jgi:zinc D-Ala-D-Ala carboxypeptidase
MGLSDKISNSFSYSDMIRSQTASRLGIDNTPGEAEIKAFKLLANNVLETLNSQFGIQISSGYRCLALNRAVGSGDTSNHIKGEAADIEPASNNRGVRLIDLLQWIYDNLEFHELIAEFFPTGWVHVAYREGLNDKILKLKDKNHDYVHLTIKQLREIYP